MQDEVFLIAEHQSQLRSGATISLGYDVPRRMFPYEAELGSDITVDTIRRYVDDNQNRPEFPSQWIENDFVSTWCV